MNMNYQKIEYMLNKVYLVTTEQGDYDDYMWNIHCICFDLDMAEN